MSSTSPSVADSFVKNRVLGEPPAAAAAAAAAAEEQQNTGKVDVSGHGLLFLSSANESTALLHSAIFAAKQGARLVTYGLGKMEGMNSASETGSSSSSCKEQLERIRRAIDADCNVANVLQAELLPQEAKLFAQLQAQQNIEIEQLKKKEGEGEEKESSRSENLPNSRESEVYAKKVLEHQRESNSAEEQNEPAVATAKQLLRVCDFIKMCNNRIGMAEKLQKEMEKEEEERKEQAAAAAAAAEEDASAKQQTEKGEGEPTAISTETKKAAEEEKEDKSAAIASLSRLNVQCHLSAFGAKSDAEELLSHTGGSGYDVVVASFPFHSSPTSSSSATSGINGQKLRKCLATVAACMSKDRRSTAHFLAIGDAIDAGAVKEVATQVGLELKNASTESVAEKSTNLAESSQVHYFQFQLYFDTAGAPLNPLESYDVVVQGSGMVESFLSAAFAKAGYTVLHLDNSDQYGGVFQTSDLFDFPPPKPSSAATAASSGGAAAVAKENVFNKEEHGMRLDVDRRSEFSEKGDLFAPHNIRKFLLDAIPLCFMANGDTIDTLVESDSARMLEFQNVDRLLTLKTAAAGKKESSSSSGEAAKAPFSVVRVPLSRADIFKSNVLSPLEMRRLMKFIKEMDTLVPSEFKEAESGEDVGEKEAKEETAEQKEKKQGLLNSNFYAHLSKTCSLSAKVIALLTLHGSLVSKEATLKQGIVTLQQFLSSVGRWGGTTPFLVSMYGSAEIPQNMCRVSAVWSGTFVLRRWIVDRSDTDNTVTLSNGQVIGATCVVVPKPSPSSAASAGAAVAEAAASGNRPSTRPSGNYSGLSRVTLVTSMPLVSWKQIEQECADVAEDEEEQDSRDSWPVPTLVCTYPYTKKKKKMEGEEEDKEGEKKPKKSDSEVIPIHIVQQGAACQQAPNSTAVANYQCAPAVLHFSVGAKDLSVDELNAVVDSLLLPAVSASEPKEEDKTAASPPGPEKAANGEEKNEEKDRAAASSSSPSYLRPLSTKDVMIRYSMTIKHGTSSSISPLPAASSTATAEAEESATAHTSGRAGESRTFFAETLFTDTLLDDSTYIREAKRVFEKVVDLVPVPSGQHRPAEGARPVFLEENIVVDRRGGGANGEGGGVNVADGDHTANLLGINQM